MQIMINGDKTIEFSAQHLATVLDALSGQPFRVAEPIIASIFRQLEAQKLVEDKEVKGDAGA